MAVVATSMVVAAATTSWANEPLIGHQFQANAYTTGGQARPDVAILADGDVLVVWRSDNVAEQDGDGSGIFGRRFDEEGHPVGTEFQVNTYTTGTQGYPAVAVDGDGDYVIAWAGYGLFGQRYDSDGSPSGGQFQINTYTTENTGFGPAVAWGSAGGFWVAWERRNPTPVTADVIGQRFDASGTAIGAEFALASDAAGSQVNPRIAALPAGEFVMAWESEGDVVARRFDSTGTAIGAQFRVNAYTTSAQRSPEIDAAGDGSFVIVWHSDDQDGDLGGVFAQRYDVTATPLGTEFQVNTYTTREQSYADVAMSSDGAFVVVWSDDYQTSGPGFDGGSDVFARHYGSDGSPTGDAFRVNLRVPNSQLSAAISAGADDRFVVAWTDTRIDDPLGGVMVTDLCIDSAADGDADGIGDSCDPCEGDRRLAINARLSFGRLGSEVPGAPLAGDEGMRLAGEFLLPVGVTFATLDPRLAPVRIRVSTAAGPGIVDAALTDVEFGGRGTVGWSTNGQATRWVYRDKTDAPLQGIVKVVVQDRSRRSPGQVRIRLRGKEGFYPLSIGDEVVNATVVVGDPNLGVCATTQFDLADCAFRSLGSRFRCH